MTLLLQWRSGCWTYSNHFRTRWPLTARTYILSRPSYVSNSGRSGSPPSSSMPFSPPGAPLVAPTPPQSLFPLLVQHLPLVSIPYVGPRRAQLRPTVTAVAGGWSAGSRYITVGARIRAFPIWTPCAVLPTRPCSRVAANAAPLVPAPQAVALPKHSSDTAAAAATATAATPLKKSQ